MATVTLTPDEQAWRDAMLANWRQWRDEKEPDSELYEGCVLMVEWLEQMTPQEVRKYRKAWGPVKEVRTYQQVWAAAEAK